MSAPLILHGMSSPNVTKVMMMLEECGLAYETRHVGVFTQEQFAPAFLALNPLAKVPVLEDAVLGQDGRMGSIAESGAILLWLAEREGKFLPAEQPARAEVIQWLMVQMANIGPMFGQLNHFNFLPEAEHTYARARYRAAARTLYRVLEERLAARRWIAGGDYSIADMATQPWAHYLERHGFDPAAHPALVAWRAAIDARPAVQRARARQIEDFQAAVTRSRKSATAEDLDKFFGRTAEVPAADYSIVSKM